MKNFQKEYAAYTASEKKVNEIYHRIAVQMDAPDSVCGRYTVSVMVRRSIRKTVLHRCCQFQSRPLILLSAIF